MVGNSAFEHLARPFADFRIEVTPVLVVYFEKPAHVVYARNFFPYGHFVVDIKVVKQAS